MRRVTVFVLCTLAWACSRSVEAEPETFGEDPDALGSEPEEFQGFEASKPISAFTSLRGSPRQLSADFAGGPMRAGVRVIPYRAFFQSGAEWYLVVDAEHLRTAVLPRAWLEANSVPTSIEDSRRARLDARFRTTDTPVDSVAKADTAGATRVALTVDMCQSAKPWERGFFDWAVAEGARRKTPLSLNVAMTGVWAKHHPGEFAQLQTWRAQHQLEITRVNHSFRHPLHCSGGSCAFLTAPNENMQSAVLLEEQDLLSRGEMPSMFFRFPGLKHDARTLSAVSQLGLYTLDGDAWLAKGQAIHDGAVILVHGNGNEPAGIRRFMTAMAGPWASALSEQRLQFVSVSDL